MDRNEEHSHVLSQVKFVFDYGVDILPTHCQVECSSEKKSTQTLSGGCPVFVLSRGDADYIVHPIEAVCCGWCKSPGNMSTIKISYDKLSG